ncbi:MAG: penicillin acylase family protein, partial [Deltaproteobacteria bacterium]|nr:penicillin acylase family protein [Deltaproteobacteria bacterium]
MRKVKFALLGIVVIAVVGFIAAYLFVHSVATRALPNYDGVVKLKGIIDEVVVYRDSHAVPHVFAKNENDLNIAVGYIMAQDRLWQMDLLRRATTGRLSEIFGEKLIKTDLFLRSLRMPEKSRMILDRMDDRNEITALEAFCDGVNQYIDGHKNDLPPEFVILKYKPEKWIPEHSLNLVSFMALDLSTGWKSELVLYRLMQKLGADMCRDFIPDTSRQRSVVYPDYVTTSGQVDLPMELADYGRVLTDLGLAVFAGSNNWAVSGKKSVTGKPILANDMHLGLNCPGIWYQMHQVVEGEFSVTGVVLPGQPCVISGHNDRIAWGFTNVMVDDMDFYLEKINPDNPAEYRFGDRWRPLEIRHETIKVKDKEPVVKKIAFTHRGPIVSEIKKIKEQAISMRWVGNEFSNEMRTVYRLCRAKNWGDFCDAFSTFGATSQNVAYADVDGNIGMYCCALVPIRKAENAIRVMPGWTDEYDWKGMVPFEKLPHVYNPASGFVSSANNKSVADSYPYYISRWFAPSVRIDRIRELLAEKQTLSIDDFKRIQADQYSKLAANMRDEIVREVTDSGTLTPLERQTLDMLSSWDGVLAKESSAASIFETFYCTFIVNVFADEMGDDLFKEYFSSILLHRHAFDNILQNRDSPWYDDIITVDKTETYADVVRQSYRDSLAYLNDRLGKDPTQWQWGKLHRLLLKHPMGQVEALDRVFKLNRGPFEIGGSWHTVCKFTYDVTKPYDTSFGVSQRHIYSLTDWNTSLSVIPTGTSGIPASDHYCDQTELYITNRYHPDLVDRELI